MCNTAVVKRMKGKCQCTIPEEQSNWSERAKVKGSLAQNCEAVHGLGQLQKGPSPEHTSEKSVSTVKLVMGRDKMAVAQQLRVEWSGVETSGGFAYLWFCSSSALVHLYSRPTPPPKRPKAGDLSVSRLSVCKMS